MFDRRTDMEHLDQGVPATGFVATLQDEPGPIEASRGPNLDSDTVDDLDGPAHSGAHVALGDALALVGSRLGRLEAERIDVVAEATRTGAFAADGHRNTASWVRATVSCSKQSSWQSARRAQLAIEHPDYLELLRDGPFSLDHYDEIVKAHSNPRCRGLLDGFVDVFAHCARTLEFADFARTVTLWVQLADQDGPTPAEQGPTRDLRIKVRKDGSCELHGHLPPEASIVFRGIFDRFVDAERDIERATAAEHDCVTGGRAPGEIRADALMAMASRAANAPVGQAPKPLVQLVVDWATVRQILAGTTDLDSGSWADRMCRTASGESVEPAAMLAAMLAGNVRVLVLDAHRRPIGLSRQGSLFTPRQREALLALYPECGFAGCDVSNRHLQADHVVARSRGGPTGLWNAVATCGHHNSWRWSHEYGFEPTPDGRWRTIRPDGTPLRPDHPV